MPPEGNGRVLPTLALVGQLGLIMVGCVLLGFLAGTYLDHLLHSGPVLTIMLLVAGVVGGMVAVYRLVVRSMENERPHGGSSS
ncbi:MAG: AtpZ/AtpI family protein [Planctomycetota bacterium]|jgi:F0F1-type ATP synthase assembly protein I